MASARNVHSSLGFGTPSGQAALLDGAALAQFDGVMLLEGSCHCQAVKFRLQSKQPVPYQRCYCSICRKTGGAGGYMINLGGEAATLHVEGKEHVEVYRALRGQGDQAKPSSHARHFCKRCGTHLWAFNDHFPTLVHPVASAIDTPLPKPTEHVHMMVASKAPWVAIEGSVASEDTADDERFDEYPEQSLADFHDQRGWSTE